MKREILSRLTGRLGGVAAQRRMVLRQERQAQSTAPTPTALTNGEVSVAITVGNTIAEEEQRASKALLQAEQTVNRCTHKSVKARQELATLVNDPIWVNHRTPVPAPAHEDGRFQEVFDLHRPMLRGVGLLILEIVFIIVELFFWYGVFSEGVSHKAAWYATGRISAVLLAILLPLAGVSVARIVGHLGHRWVMDYPGIGRRERWGTIAALAVGAVVVAVVFTLVNTRFGEDTRPVGSTPLPSFAMAALFVVVILGDMVARVFAISEIRSHTRERDRRLARRRDAVIAANQAHTKAWLALRAAIQVQLGRVDQVYGAGGILLTDNRATNSHLPAPAAVDVRTDAHQNPSPGALAVPSAAPMRLHGQPMTLNPVRRVSDVIDTLRSYPPVSQEALVRELDERIGALHKLPSAGSGRRGDQNALPIPAQRSAPGDDQPANGARPVGDASGDGPEPGRNGLVQGVSFGSLNQADPTNGHDLSRPAHMPESGGS
ncbi:hypothetical protein AB0M43_35460 [Longispora sp. NPDC051575]|uniref:hypothetical protein n=1 Tax=Longispora sp. NPDC051575 TaxID=3154943 RepID=UPI0034246AA7